MKKVSRMALAKAFVSLVDERNYQALIGALARELVASHRTAEVELAVRDINRELLRQKKHLEATVTSVHTLPAEVRRAMEVQLKQRTGAATVSTILRQNPDLIGGVVAETPDELWNLSLLAKLEQLEA